MTVEAPLHGERLGLEGKRHAVDASMAGGAPDACVEVNVVRERDELGKVVHARPLDRTAGEIAFTNGRERGSGGPHFGVAIHADSGGGNSGEGRLFDGGVAVAAIDAEASDVVLMAERDGLFARNILVV